MTGSKVVIDRLLLVFPIAAIGNRPARAAAASMQTLEITESGREFEDVIPIDPETVGQYAKDFNLSLLDEVSTLTARVASLENEKANLQTEVERLTALVPAPLPERSIYPRELLGRLTMHEVVAAIRSDDDAVIYAVANLQTTVSPINLDSEETKMLVGSLVLAGILTPERMTEILA